jgi:hypothetical protein
MGIYDENITNTEVVNSNRRLVIVFFDYQLVRLRFAFIQ